MIKNVVFDIGNVLADFRIKEFMLEKGIEPTVIKRIIKASVFSPYWNAFERQELTEEEALKAFASLDPEIEEDIRKAYTNVSGMLTERAFAVPLVKGLKEKGYKVYCLSNYSKKAYDECKDSLVFMQYTEGALLSFQAGLTKPDPAMFKMFLEKFDLKPEECLFIDDAPENVETAKSLGFNGIIFTSYEEAVKEMETYLG